MKYVRLMPQVAQYFIAAGIVVLRLHLIIVVTFTPIISFANARGPYALQIYAK